MHDWCLVFHADSDSEILRNSLFEAVSNFTPAEMELLQGGRNCTVRLNLAEKAEAFSAELISGDDRASDKRTAGDLPDLAVKSFGRQAAWRDLIASWRGSKARRAYKAAECLYSADVGTPAPVAVMERWQGKRLLASFLVTKFEPEMYSFKRKLVDLYNKNGPCAELMELLEVVAEAVASMHNAGFMHRDLGNQNIFLRRSGGQSENKEAEVLFIDLNRGFCLGKPLSNRQRARDISRIHLPSDFLRVFLEMYWRGSVPPEDFVKFEKKYRRRYAWHTKTRHLRHPFRKASPPSPDGEYPPDRELWIWDDRSAQAIPPFRTGDRNRLREKGFVFNIIRATLPAAFPAWKRMNSLCNEAFQSPVPDVGQKAAIALDLRGEDSEREIELLRELGAENVLVRLYHHENEAQRLAVLDRIDSLHAEGFGVALALVQDRRAVREPVAWEIFGREVLERTASKVRWVEVGHAINRVKWGLWGCRDLATLMGPLANWRKEYPQVRFVGPGGIDFEPARLSAAIKALPEGASFSVLSHHLYVDRRGAPESLQGSFDAVKKMALLRALGESSGRCGAGLIVSEFNWPLLGTGVWSPVGSPYVSPGVRFNDPSVDENEAAVYMIRYLLLGICSGLAEEMVFWRLVAHGYGLVDERDPAGWRRRPGFEALRIWYRRFKNASFLEAHNEGKSYDLKFCSSAGEPFRILWQADGGEPSRDNLVQPDLPDEAEDIFGVKLSGRAVSAAWRDGVPICLK